MRYQLLCPALGATTNGGPVSVSTPTFPQHSADLHTSSPCFLLKREQLPQNLHTGWIRLDILYILGMDSGH